VSVTATLLAPSAACADAGELRWVLRSVEGPSGATRLGRFCLGDARLRGYVEAHLAQEEALRPDAVHAEIVHLPGGPDANVVCRPSFRGRELDYLGQSAEAGRRLDLSDLRLTLVGDRLVLFSASLGKQVLPRLTCSHNAQRSPLPVYRFLCALQHGREDRDLGFSWGPLEDAPFLPRVTLGNVVLHEAHWCLARAELEALRAAEGAARFREAQRLRATLELPRWVGLADGDNVLPIDLENPLLGPSLAGDPPDRGAASGARAKGPLARQPRGPGG
jgi:lantibiotic biosynthesis protein